MELDQIEAQPLRATDCSDEFFHECFDVVTRKLPWRRLIHENRNRRRSDRMPASLGDRQGLASVPRGQHGAFPSRVRELNAKLGPTEFAAERHHASHCSFTLVRVQADAIWTDAAF